ncbi:uncharacterized protein LOC126473667 [Schistocerca serialis cubense]|uniref:uncharacterized protein LOC126473667 n=1 Tax=Schistocerca serialis cubense TaxID=2023355 RepID=UPI00214EA07F|nr:uncharacterized protein LOC126473667 [Schistocerca serialis cubense]
MAMLQQQQQQYPPAGSGVSSTSCYRSYAPPLAAAPGAFWELARQPPPPPPPPPPPSRSFCRGAAFCRLPCHPRRLQAAVTQAGATTKHGPLNGCAAVACATLHYPNTISHPPPPSPPPDRLQVQTGSEADPSPRSSGRQLVLGSGKAVPDGNRLPRSPNPGKKGRRTAPQRSAPAVQLLWARASGRGEQRAPPIRRRSRQAAATTTKPTANRDQRCNLAAPRAGAPSPGVAGGRTNPRASGHLPPALTISSRRTRGAGRQAAEECPSQGTHGGCRPPGQLLRPEAPQSGAEVCVAAILQVRPTPPPKPPSSAASLGPDRAVATVPRCERHHERATLNTVIKIYCNRGALAGSRSQWRTEEAASEQTVDETAGQSAAAIGRRTRAQNWPQSRAQCSVQGGYADKLRADRRSWRGGGVVWRDSPSLTPHRGRPFVFAPEELLSPKRLPQCGLYRDSGTVSVSVLKNPHLMFFRCAFAVMHSKAPG